jgi:hypothetical protein
MEFKNAIIDVVTGQTTLVDLSDVEIAEFKQFRIMQAEKDKIEIAEAEAKAQAKAELLDRLGITADEAKLLLS